MDYFYQPRTIEDPKLPFSFAGYVIYSGANSYKSTVINILNRHENVEILYFKEGAGKVRNGSEIYEVKGGDIAVVNTNCIHCVYTDTQLSYYYLITDKYFLLENDIDTGSIVFKSIVSDNKTAKLFENVISSYEKKEKFAVACIRASILELFVNLVLNYIDDKKKSNRGANSHMIAALEYIELNLGKTLTVDKIASAAGYSKYHFIRVFKQTTGYTVFTFINMRRCEFARVLLERGENSISEIGEKCGFTDISHFSKTFKHHIGMSPREYKQRNNRH